MQRSSNGRQSNGRRNYTRNSNAFKFHNFVFNEDNQSFCLEEQHGNKKITVMHWKKSEERLLPEKENPIDAVPYAKPGKTISRQLSKTSSDSTSATKRRTHEVTTSASFPPPSGRPVATASLSILSPSCSSHSSQSALPPSSPSLSSLSHLDSPGLSHLRPTDQFYSPVVSPYLNRIRHHPLSKSTTSSSSIATSSSSSSSQVANWLNQSLNDLDLTELPHRYQPHRNVTIRRKPAQVRRIMVDVDSDKSDDDQDSDKEMPSNSDSGNIFRTYRRYLEQIDRNDDVQTQPLDLSVKTTRDRNNNKTTIYDWNINSILGLKQFIKSEDEESDNVRPFTSANSKFNRLKRDDNHLPTADVRFLSDWEPLHRTSSIRSEAISPSALISSVKCCSPSSHSSSTLGHGSTSACVNPFMFPSPLLSHAPTSSSSSLRRHHSPLDEAPSVTSRHPPYMFDAFLEEEISKMLESTSKSSSHATAKSEYDDIEERIEDKLRSLHREVLSRKEAFEGNLDRPGQDHLKLHFKLDANRNLEPYGSEGKRTLSEPCLQNASQVQTFVPSKGRPSQRNQIKRQLEDAFKQNGFLVKTKQVSDANNSAMFCKFRQLRKYTRYYLKSWQNHLPDEVNKLWKGFLPPKTERPQYLGAPSAPSPESSSSSSSNC